MIRQKYRITKSFSRQQKNLTRDHTISIKYKLKNYFGSELQ